MNWNEIKFLLTNKLALLVIVISIVWSMFDISTRLLPNNILNIKEKDDAIVTPIASPNLAASMVNELNQRYQKYGKIIDESPDNKIFGMSMNEQNNQQGELTEVFIDNNKLSLKAVIRNDALAVENSVEKTVALISIVDINTGSEKIEKYAHNSEIYGYHLTIEKNTQVKLVRMFDGRSQKIILTMYKN
ncbi:hypothetical protein [Cognaticolwellia mytili]|uniref:hypothetical protein n=1 Tax=Cognaticolwellia mytili TaxID=1888913 RepID=UPI000A174EB0|nr:hypothetical protein [Cognaticolwellia mytili]